MSLDAKTVKRTKKYRWIRSSLLEQLSRSDNDQPQFVDMVEDYMSMYVTKELCKDDIAERGVTIVGIGSTGQTVTKKNEAVDSLLKVNQQMIKLLDMLGIKPDTGSGDEEEM